MGEMCRCIPVPYAAVKERERTDLSGIDLGLGEDDICHVLNAEAFIERGELKGMCGSPYDCKALDASTEEYRDQPTCADCGRKMCPECRQQWRTKYGKT